MEPKSLNITLTVFNLSMLESEGPLCGPTSNRLLNACGGPRSVLTKEVIMDAFLSRVLHLKLRFTSIAQLAR